MQRCRELEPLPVITGLDDRSTYKVTQAHRVRSATTYETKLLYSSLDGGSCSSQTEDMKLKQRCSPKRLSAYERLERKQLFRCHVLPQQAPASITAVEGILPNSWNKVRLNVSVHRCN